jgi:predicted O-methyltransferase YrrM
MADLGGFPPGHFYSPYPSIEQIREDADRIWDTPPELPRIDLRASEQLELLAEFARFYDEMPFPEIQEPGFRYFFENAFFSFADGTVLYSMLRYLGPKRIIEVGSGFSSALILDTNERFFDNSIECTFIEPYPDQLHELARTSDLDRATLVAQSVQSVPLDLFQSLGERDILFIDSTHVSKAGSDVNHLFFNVLPVLAPGVHVHLHDIFYPFEYPREWILDLRRAWSEAYVLRAFLEYNDSFAIRFFNDYLANFHSDRVEQSLPAMLRHGGGSIWLAVEDK